MTTLGLLALLTLPGLASGCRNRAGAPAATGSPPPHAIVNSQIRVLPRAAGRHDLQLHIALPDSYGGHPERRYPVLYLCDGYWDFALLTGIRGNLVYDKAAPEMIIVGLGYAGDKPDYEALRRYDYTPVPHGDDKGGGRSGHAAELLATLEQEIIPFVEKEYRADSSYRVLGGSSLGGLFALYVMIERPELFQGVIAPSPAVDWANRWLFRHEADFAAHRKDLAVRLFVSGAGAEDAGFLAAIQQFGRQMEERHYRGFAYQWRLVDGERHAGTKAESYNRGVRFAFAPLAPSSTSQ